MGDIVAWVIATIVTIPLLGWYLIYITTVKISKNKSKSLRLASDWTTILFMVAVYFIMVELWARSFLWIILAAFFFIAILVTWIHWKLSGDIQVGKLFRGIWRFNFILFFLLYVLLFSYGLILRIFASVSSS
jgi:predicted lysophospholipase L1 biosynthesis ABC-type transport system permease subunit